MCNLQMSHSSAALISLNVCQTQLWIASLDSEMLWRRVNVCCQLPSLYQSIKLHYYWNHIRRAEDQTIPETLQHCTVKLYHWEELLLGSRWSSAGLLVYWFTGLLVHQWVQMFWCSQFLLTSWVNQEILCIFLERRHISLHCDALCSFFSTCDAQSLSFLNEHVVKFVFKADILIWC